MEDLKEAVKEFFSYLDLVEESESGTRFHPVHISCCRVMMQSQVSDCLKKMKELSEYKPC